MKPRPTPKNLRAGQTLYVIDLDASLRGTRPHLGVVRVSNLARAAVRRNAASFPWALAFFSRRQALSRCRELLAEARAVLKDMSAGVQEPSMSPHFMVAMVQRHRAQEWFHAA